MEHFYVSPVELQIDEIAHEILRRIKAGRVRRVVLDAIGDLEFASQDSARYRDFLYSLTQAFATHNLTTMLLVETGGVIAGTALSTEVSYMSDNILLLEMLYGDDLTRTVRILKSRGSRHEGRRLEMRISNDGVEVG